MRRRLLSQNTSTCRHCWTDSGATCSHILPLPWAALQSAEQGKTLLLSFLLTSVPELLR